MAGSHTRRSALVAAGALVMAMLAAGAGAGGYLTTDSARSSPQPPALTTPPPPRVLADAVAPPTTQPTPAGTIADAAGVRAAVAAAVTSPDLGARLRAEVVDVPSGTVLYSQGATTPTAPASTAKLLTAAAILSVHAVTDRFETRIVRGPGSAVTIIGGGDPTLTCGKAGAAAAYPGAARMSDLAAALRRSGIRPSRIVVDDNLFGGPSISPDWAPEDVPSSYESAITALMCDGGRAAPGDVNRSSTPDLDTGHALAAALGTPDLIVSRGRASVGAPTVASVRSATIGTLVFQMLQESDNVIAEVLGRQVALVESAPVTFAGAAAAIRAVLSRAGLNFSDGMRDASGLAAADRLSPAALVGVVRLLASRTNLRAVLSDLPVAGWSGTLADRYTAGTAARGAGAVRAKTGTLTGVSTLAGVVHDRSGRLLAIALMADRTVSTGAADAALDRVAAVLVSCGCTS